MGGFGSTRWNGRRTKRTVESCETLDIGLLTREEELCAGIDSQGHVTLTRNGGFSRYVRFSYWYDGSIDADYLILDYSSGTDREQLFIPLRRTSAHFGGERLWLTCPLCSRYERLSKLYRPRNERFFACRQCHKLAYRSTHRTNYGPARLMRFIGRMQMRFALQDGKCRS